VSVTRLDIQQAHSGWRVWRPETNEETWECTCGFKGSVLPSGSDLSVHNTELFRHQDDEYAKANA
jgi:hypothetical protein